MGTCEFAFLVAPSGFGGRDSVQKLRSPHSISSTEALNEHYRAIRGSLEKGEGKGAQGRNGMKAAQLLSEVVPLSALKAVAIFSSGREAW